MADYFVKDGEEFKPVKDALHTQDDLDRVINDRLERERNKFKDYDDLKTKVGTLTQELTEKSTAFTTEKSELETKLKKTALEVDKVKILHEFKLSDDLAEFVTGETPEELRARAEKLAKSAKGGVIKIDKDKKPDEKAPDSKALAKKLFGKSDD